MIRIMLLQIDLAADVLAEPAKELTLSFWDLAFKGGWIMIPLVLLWFIAVYLFIERFWSIKKAAKEDANFMNRIKEYVHDDKIESAVSLCRNQNTPVAHMIEKGLQ